MNLRRRLSRLECNPFRRRIAKPDLTNGEQPWILPAEECRMVRSLQRKMCLPLPLQSTDEERAHALELLRTAQQMLPDDTSGLDSVREFALALHQRYGTDPTWGR
jgi:hypothetical protein